MDYGSSWKILFVCLLLLLCVCIKNLCDGDDGDRRSRHEHFICASCSQPDGGKNRTCLVFGAGDYQGCYNTPDQKVPSVHILKQRKIQHDLRKRRTNATNL